MKLPENGFLIQFNSLKLFEFRMLAGIFFFTLFSPGNTYSIPQQIEALCQKFSLSVCAGKPKTSDANKQGTSEAPKPREFTKSEQEALTRLLEYQKRLQLREKQLDQREAQIKALQEDVQRQVTQLEDLQKNIEQDIEAKKALDTEQFNKVVAMYDKMEPAKAALSLAEIDPKVAVQILMKLKDKKSSEILSNMKTDKASQLIDGLTRKK